MSSKKDIRKTLSTILGDELKRLRKLKNHTQQEVAESASISQVAIGQYEKGKRMPSTEVVVALANFFKVDPDELLELRRQAVFETVALLGDEAPPAIKNERNMIAHGWNPGTNSYAYPSGPDMYLNSPVENYTAENETKKTKVIVKIEIKTDGTIFADGKKIGIEQLSDYLQSLSEQKAEK